MKPSLVLLLCLVSVPLVSQTANQETCSVSGELLKGVWGLERELTVIAPHSPAPATAVREFLKEGDTDGRRKSLFACAFNDDMPESTKAMFMAELTNFEFIVNSQKENGGLAKGNDFALPTTKGLPLDLSDVAPSCKEVVDSDLVGRIERFVAQEQGKAKEIKVKDVLPLYVESVKLNSCEDEAEKIGYKDAALRMLRALGGIETVASVAQSNEQTEIIKAIERASSSPRLTPVRIGPTNCSATIRDWGFQKTVDWTCF